MFTAYSIRTFRLEEEAQVEAQEKASVCERKEMEWKKRRLAEKKRSEIPLLGFYKYHTHEDEWEDVFM